jgi:hypothetical protein
MLDFQTKLIKKFRRQLHVMLNSILHANYIYSDCVKLKIKGVSMFSMITNIYNKKTKEPTLMELFIATGNLKKFFLITRNVRCVHHR